MIQMAFSARAYSRESLKSMLRSFPHRPGKCNDLPLGRQETVAKPELERIEQGREGHLVLSPVPIQFVQGDFVVGTETAPEELSFPPVCVYADS